MRVALVSWEALHALPVGGVAVHVSSLARALAARGHDVHLFTRRGPGQRLRDAIGGVSYHRCPAGPREAFVDEAEAFARPLAHYLEAEAARGGPFGWTLAHDWPSFPAALAWTGRDPARRLAVAFHSTEWGRSGAWPDRGLSARIAGVEREACARAAAVMAVSAATRREVEAQFAPPGWKMATVYHGVDPAPLEGPGPPGEFEAHLAPLGLVPGRPLALCVGRLDAGRGADRLARAWPAVAAALPEARLLWVGGGPMAGELERALAPPPGRPATAVFAGDRGAAFTACACRACAALAAPARRDPYGQAALCAWAAGRPVAALPGGAAAEFVADGVTGRVAGEDGLAAALGDLLGRPGLAGWMGANGRAAVETAFTWDRAAQKVEETLARCARLAETPALETRPEA